MPSRQTFRDGIKKNLNIPETDMSEAGVPVYINPDIGIRIRGADGIAGSKGGLNIGFHPAPSGKKYLDFTETAA